MSSFPGNSRWRRVAATAVDSNSRPAANGAAGLVEDRSVAGYAGRNAREFVAGQCLAQGGETPLSPGSGAQVARRESTCGEVTEPSVFMHPPYRGGTGYSFAAIRPGESAGRAPCRISLRDRKGRRQRSGRRHSVPRRRRSIAPAAPQSPPKRLGSSTPGRRWKPTCRLGRPESIDPN